MGALSRAVNHFAIFRNVGVDPLTYPYYDPATIGLDYAGFTAARARAPPRSVFLLHACAHNPTGVDPSEAQWAAIADVMLERGHYAFFDSAYQGFASGDLERDAWAVRYFVGRGVPMLVCQVRSPLPCVCIPLLPWADATGVCRALRRTRGCTASASARCTSSRRRRRRRTG